MLKTRPKPNSALRLFKNFSVIEEQLSAFSATEAGNLKGKKKKKLSKISERNLISLL